MTTRLILTRHGETEWNVDGKVQGTLDSPLTHEGREQARRLSTRLTLEKIDMIYSSPLGRAVSTAQLIGAPRKLNVQVCPEFREIDFGIWEGKAWRELRSDHPEWFAEWDRFPYRFHFPGGENMSEVLARAKPKLRDLCNFHSGKTLCIVSHGITLKVLVTDLMGYELSDWLLTPWQANTALNIFDVDEDKITPVILGDSSHLEQDLA